jgi:hypothetical protein
MAGKIPGKVTSAGFNTSISCVHNDIKTEWLTGGATSWRKDVLLNHVNKELTAGYAFIEDLNFSYPIGKQYNLFVCASAQVTHAHVSRKGLFNVRFGEKQVIDRMLFVVQHKDLSLLKCAWASLGQTIENAIRIFFNKQPQYIFVVFGNIYGVMKGLLRIMINNKLNVIRAINIPMGVLK